MGLKKSVSTGASKVGDIGGVKYAVFCDILLDVQAIVVENSGGGLRVVWHLGDAADELLLDRTGLRSDGPPFPVASNCHVSHALRQVLQPFCSTGFTWSK